MKDGGYTPRLCCTRGLMRSGYWIRGILYGKRERQRERHEPAVRSWGALSILGEVDIREFRIAQPRFSNTHQLVRDLGRRWKSAVVYWRGVLRVVPSAHPNGASAGLVATHLV